MYRLVRTGKKFSLRTISWITNEFKKEMVKRDCLFREGVENPESKNHIEYKNQRNVLIQKIRLAKKEANFRKTRS